MSQQIFNAFFKLKEGLEHMGSYYITYSLQVIIDWN